MLKILVACLLSIIFFSAFAQNEEPDFVLLPNINTNYLMSVKALRAVRIENQAIKLVKYTLKITAGSPYKKVRIRLLYNDSLQIQALIVSLLSSQFKSMELVRINVDKNFNAISVIKNYKLQLDDLNQSPVYVNKSKPICPDNEVQFVIGNNFNDESVKNEVQKVYQLAQSKGYHPILMDINNPKSPQPTVQAYRNWLSCPNVKGFYNESHGWEEGIVLADDDFVYSNIDKYLVDKLKHEVILFDSCETFHPPLLTSLTNKDKGNVQQYIGGYILLPFGPSERTASCIWAEAFDQQELNQKMIETCAIKNDLEPYGFKIAGNGDNHLASASG